MALDKITTGVIADDAITSDQLGVGAIAGSDIAADVIEVIPHIKPGTLQPAVAGKLLDGTTSHSGNYGTAQSDGKKYYYTDIKGSKPIKDPRIGAHFGSQRHMVDSIQELEQETAINRKKVYSIDGREWVRIVGTAAGNVTLNNSSVSSQIYINNTTVFIEITGYFNNINVSHICENTRMFRYSLDGATEVATDYGNSGTDSPLISRYVECGSFFNIPLSTTLGIHTIKLRANKADMTFNAFELIAQDTTSTATKSQIQIPAQNVVSYGKKFSLSSSPLHYNPFAFKTDGSTAWASGAHNGTSLPVGTGSSHNIDTATSLGLEKWKHSDNYYKPYNGGRVVIWVDSSGNIKTSVTVMPPNAKSMADSAISAKANASVANDTASPTFEAHTTDMHENNLSEVAKTFHFREFGNGAANGGTGATWADASMLTASTDDIAYVMDDGLTGVCAEDVQDQSSYNHILPQVDNEKDIFFTFIGSGISYRVHHFGAGYYDVAQDLPYGSHIMTLQRNNAASTISLWIDGVAITAAGMSGTYASITEPTFYQPKKPPVPEDAVVLADYMLMADFVPTASYGEHVCSKGTRWVSCTRDWFYGSGAAVSLSIAMTAHHGFRAYNNNATKDWKLPFFGNGIMIKHNVETGRSSNTTFKINSAAYGTGFSASGNYVAGNRVGSSHNTGGWDTTNNDGTYTISQQTNGANSEEFTGVKGLDLRVNEFWLDDNEAAYYTLSGAEIATPIHTSSHYQTFETSYLHELVGGDRNMEQHNLVVTPDGKTWDEVTRDTSYLSNTSLVVRHGTNAWNSTQEFNLQRGFSHNLHMMSKEWITAYNKWLCLVDGVYQIGGDMLHRYSAGINLKLNDSTIANIHAIADASDHNQHSVNSFNTIFEAKRGDTLHIVGERHGADWSNINIKKL